MFPLFFLTCQIGNVYTNENLEEKLEMDRFLP